jgi:hypothetical protein
MKDQNNRVLAYATSRLLTDEEMATVSGAATGTSVTTGSGANKVTTCDDDNSNPVTCPAAS